MEERICIIRDSELVFQHPHPEASASLHDERVTAIWEEPKLYLDFYPQDVADGMRSSWGGRLEAAKTQRLPASRRAESLDARQKTRRLASSTAALLLSFFGLWS